VNNALPEPGPEVQESSNTALASGPRSVAVGGDVDGSIVSGDNNVIVSLRADRQSIDRLLAGIAPSHLRQLPADLVDFTGRAEEAQRLIIALSASGKAVTWVIWGMGGAGKSALAMHVAHRLIDYYPDAQLLIELEGTSERPLTPAEAMARVIRSFLPMAQLPDKESEILSIYRSVLVARRALIIFDDAHDTIQVRPLLPPASCAAIITSRRTIVLPGAERIELGPLNPDEAHKLLEAIIGAGHPETQKLTEVARLCSYLPLALRVAGTFLAMHPGWRVDEYVRALTQERQRLRRLRFGDDLELDVAASLTLSETQLTREQPALVKLWQMLWVFVPTFDRMAAATVWEVPADEARDALSALVARSMLLFDPEKNRYWLHPLMRDVAGRAIARDQDSERVASAIGRFIIHYLQVLASANALYKEGGDSMLAGLRLFDLERLNIDWGRRAVVARVTNSEHEATISEHEAMICFSYCDLGLHLTGLRYSPQQRLIWAEAALVAARRLNDRGREASALCNWAAVNREIRTNLEGTLEAFEEALAIARALHDKKGEIINLCNMARVHVEQGDPARALELAEKSLAIAREAHDRRSEVGALNCLGNALAGQGDSHEAAERFWHALIIARELGDRNAEAASLVGWGRSSLATADFARAIELYAQVLAIARELGDGRAEMDALKNLGFANERLGSVYCEQGQPGIAIDYFDRAVSIAREQNDGDAQMHALGNLGNAFLAIGNSQGAVDKFGQLLELAQNSGDRRTEAKSLSSLGFGYLALNQTDRGIDLLNRSLTVSIEIGDRTNEAISLYNLGLGHWAQGEFSAASEALERAPIVVQNSGDQAGELKVYQGLANLYAAVGDARRAAEISEHVDHLTRLLREPIDNDILGSSPAKVE
jgi:tetratricopeptide (TPR) repeat protein